MKPYIICHMLSSVDGKIDGAALSAVMGEAEYEATAAKLNGDAWICGRTTMQQHFEEDEPFVSASNTPAGPRPVFVARRAKSYAISVDTLGKLRWPDGDLGANHLICVVSEQVPEDYLAMLREKEISFIVSGKSTNGAFLQADLVDEVSLLLVPGIDGRHDIPAVFDGVNPSRNTAVPLRLKSVEQRGRDALWIRYEVVRSETAERRNNAKA